MSVIARRIRAIPERSAIDTWRFIVELISGSGSDSRRKLEAVAGIASCLIADETPEKAPIVIAGSGPRLRIYCLYGEEAITGEGSNEAHLNWDPTAGEWVLWFPAPSEDIAWVRDELAKCDQRIVPYDPEEEPASPPRVESPADLNINVEVFKRP